MNIFYIDSDPKLCAEWAVDSHCVKMILESAQLLSTAHRLLDGDMYIDDSSGRKIKRWRLSDDRETMLYSATHINHPSAVWVRESNNNYNWLWCYLYEHCNEYTHRYGKVHKIEQTGLLHKLYQLPHNIPVAPKTQPPQAMPEEYRSVNSSVEGYRNYYKYGKSHLHKWKNRNPPQWIME